MSAAPAPSEPYERLWRRLPAWLRPLSSERPGRGEQRLVENAVLILVGLLLAVATVYDLGHQAGINHRLGADLQTWRHYTRHDYKNVSVDRELLGISSGHDVACGNTVPGPPNERVQICLVLTGPTRGGLRSVAGGWYLPAKTVNDVRPSRYACFGAIAHDLCPGSPGKPE
jgi:hypothetical protein